MPVPGAKKKARAKLIKKRFLYWQRIARNEIERRPKRAEIEKIKERQRKDRDRHANWGDFRTGLRGIRKNLGFDLLAEAKARIARHNEKNPLKIFDAGCGAGIALAELKRKFRSKMRTVGLVLEKTPGEKYAGIDRLLVGNILMVEPHENFDIIFSHAGAIWHTNLPTTAIERTVQWLKPGGIAMLEINPTYYEEFCTVLRRNGITKWRYNYRALVFRKPARKLPWQKPPVLLMI